MTKREQIEAWIKEPESAWEASRRIDEIYDLLYMWKPPLSDRPGLSASLMSRITCASVICWALQEHTRTRDLAAQWVAGAFADILDEFENTPADDLSI